MVARHSPRAALLATLLAGLGMASHAGAEVRVSVQYTPEEHADLARRLVSELVSEGYAVELVDDAGPSPCEAKGAQTVATGESRAWIRVTSSATEGADAVASICFLGSLPFLQQASASAPSSDPRQLAVVTAEALNGLRSKVSPALGAPAAPRREVPPSSPTEPPRSTGLVNSMALGVGVLASAPDYPAAPGVVVRANLGLTSLASLVIDGLVPTSGAELASASLTATVRTAWLRVGPRLHWAAGDFELSGALLAGAAVTWATAVALPPRIGTADVSGGALFSLAAALEYPRRSPVFAAASASASALLPGLRLNLADGAAPRGSWPLEAAIALGARWGGEP